MPSSLHGHLIDSRMCSKLKAYSREGKLYLKRIVEFKCYCGIKISLMML